MLINETLINDILSFEYDEDDEDLSKNKLLLVVHKGNDSKLKAKLTNKLERYIPESYVECYPGVPEQYSEYVSNKETLPKELLFDMVLKWLMVEKLRELELGKEMKEPIGLLLRKTHCVS
ncbi:hypothetical protein NPIL_501981 [Nephila pilipes]|uniref:Uncharacterized protein n=1 Tax=Nephila pilipes TaxID=299642 RepID=A0A8X6NWP0_NEPPI|nr:hypothetical protein NPIL_501981 [Nephila pilipes]